MKAAGSAATISVLQNVYAEEMVHKALPEAKVDQYESVDLMYQALNSGRADAAATDMSSTKWFVAQNPDQYIEGGYGWDAQTYSCAVKKGDPDFLHFVDIVFREAMTGRRLRDLCGLVQEVVRRGSAGAAGRLPERDALDASADRKPRRMGYVLNFGAVLRGFDDLLSGLGAGPRHGARRPRRRLADRHRRGLCRGLSAAGRRGAVVAAYVGFIRNVPILVLALFAFFALPRYGIRFSNTTTFAAVLAIYAGAYLDRVVPRRDPDHPARAPSRPPARSA